MVCQLYHFSPQRAMTRMLALLIPSTTSSPTNASTTGHTPAGPTCESSTLFFHRKDNGLDGVVEWSIPRRSVDDIDACTKLCVSRFLLTLYCRQREDGVVLNVLHVDRSTFTSCCTKRAHKNSIHPERKQFRWCELRGKFTSDHVLRYKMNLRFFRFDT